MHVTFDTPQMSYNFFHELIDFIEHYWCKRKRFFSDYYFISLCLNQSLKWKKDYIFLVKNRARKRKKCTSLLIPCLTIWKCPSQESSHSILLTFLKSKIHSMWSFESLEEIFWVPRKKKYLMLLKMYLRTYIITIAETPQS